ncbi:hypothetical protein Vadar_024703 [Vaccinium darrowii]|uniref:Uncharacterized protein n=1 Tax=Vaccinium darrowii TaxID=229202 RepID=A0ACB7YZ03_9ERIC|nr:hypothetical protein Vadar_024703 [Vaccinium darrowii]
MDGQICFCGRVEKINCSWTTSNPGRRFIGCEHYGKPGACGYFMWVDTSMCDRARVVIPGLLRSIRRLEAQVRREKEMQMYLVVALITSWILWTCGGLS